MNAIGYYAVRYGGHVRICDIRTDDLGLTCRNTFGLVSERMQICYVASNKNLVRSTKHRNSQLEKAENWFPVPDEYLDKLALAVRKSHQREELQT